MSDVYQDLREQLDQYSVGFPATESGVELKILKKLFSEEEARMYLNMSMMLETPEAVAARTNQDVEKVRSLLAGMKDKGVIFGVNKEDGPRYGAAPFVVGSYEFQVKDMDREFAELFEQYFTEAFGPQAGQYTPIMRPIPVNKSIDHSWAVAPYDDIRNIFKGKEKIAVANCICRTQQGLLEKGCDKPAEVCFMFGSHADYYVDKGMGRMIDEDEAIKIIDKCDEAGLVPQPFSAQNPGGLCNCCGDCCGILRGLKLQPKPAAKVTSSYFAEVDQELCSGCETCVDRCQMDAITVDEVAAIYLDRCIGCGLCVTTCPEEALSLKLKPEEQRKTPPGQSKETIMQMAMERGKSLIPLAVMKGSGN